MYGLVLEGGGTKGAYHLGVYKALMELGIEISAIAGTSIGAINGAMLVQGDFEKCYKLWQNLNHSMIFNISDEEAKRLNELSIENKRDRDYIKDMIKGIISEGGINTDNLLRLLNENIDEEKFRNSKVDFGMVTVNLSDLKPLYIYKEDIPKGQLMEYLMASASLPVFKKDRLNGKIYIDGAFYDNLPFTMLVERGYEKLIVVRTFGAGLVRKFNENDNFIEICPNEDLGSTLNVDREKSNYNMELGYYDTLKKFLGYSGKHYYMKMERDENYFFDYFLKIGDDDIKSLEKLLKVSTSLPSRRSLLENILPKIGNLLGLEPGYEYSELFINLLEVKAKETNLNKFKVYEFEDILDRLEGRNILEVKKEENKLDKFIEKVDIIALFNRERILLDVANIIVRKR